MAGFFAKVAADLHANPKIRRAGRNAREVFEHVLRINAGAGATGAIDVSHLDPDHLAYELMMSVDEARDGVERCLTTFIPAKGPLLRVDGDVVAIVGWDDEEWGRGSTSMTERDRKTLQRERKRAAKAAGPAQPELPMSGHVSGQPAVCPDTPEASGLSGPGEERRGEETLHTPSRDRVVALAAEMLTAVRQTGAGLAHELGVTFQRSNPMDVERLATAAVATWVAEGGEAVVRDRIGRLIAFRRARARAERHLRFWVETTWWNADGIAKDLAQPMDQAAARAGPPGRSRAGGGAIGRAPPSADLSATDAIDPKTINPWSNKP
jgi:hypothetical protein